MRDALKRKFSTQIFFFGECPSNDVTHVGRKRAFGVVAEEEETLQYLHPQKEQQLSKQRKV